jgi:hypothetical protein
MYAAFTIFTASKIKLKDAAAWKPVNDKPAAAAGGKGHFSVLRKIMEPYKVASAPRLRHHEVLTKGD